MAMTTENTAATACSKKEEQRLRKEIQAQHLSAGHRTENRRIGICASKMCKSRRPIGPVRLRTKPSGVREQWTESSSQRTATRRERHQVLRFAGTENQRRDEVSNGSDERSGRSRSHYRTGFQPVRGLSLRPVSGAPFGPQQACTRYNRSGRWKAGRENDCADQKLAHDATQGQGLKTEPNSRVETHS